MNDELYPRSNRGSSRYNGSYTEETDEPSERDTSAGSGRSKSGYIQLLDRSLALGHRILFLPPCARRLRPVVPLPRTPCTLLGRRGSAPPEHAGRTPVGMEVD